MSTMMLPHKPLIAGKRSDISPRTLLLGLLLAVSCFYANLAKDSYMDDFRAFYLASVTSHQHLDPYVNHVDLGEQYANSLWDRKDSLFIYPPSALFFIAPLGHLRYDPARIAFGSMMALIMVGILFSLHRRFPRQTLVLFALFLTLPMVKNIDNGNIDVLILALTLAAFYIEDSAAAGLLLGIAISIKLAPILAVAWFLSRRRFKTAAWSLASSATLAAAAYLRWGSLYWREFFDHLVHHETPGLPTLGHVFTTIYKVKDRVLVTSDGVYAYQHDISGYLQNPLHILGRFGSPIGLLVVSSFMAWLFFSRRGKALTAEQSFFLFLPVALLANNLLWPMGLVACFPLIVLLVDNSATPNLTAALLLVPLILTKQVIGNWNFGLWLLTAAWCVWKSGWLATPQDKAVTEWPVPSATHHAFDAYRTARSSTASR
jgi:hypothetical protein